MSDDSLPTFRFPASTHIVQVQPPQHGPATLASPALEVFTDLAQNRAATVQPQTSLSQAELKMIYQGVRLLFVVSDMPSVDGILTAADIAGDRPMRLVHQRQVKYQDLTAADVMTSLADIDAIPFPRCNAPLWSRWWPRWSSAAAHTCWWSIPKPPTARRASAA